MALGLFSRLREITTGARDGITRAVEHKVFELMSMYYSARDWWSSYRNSRYQEDVKELRSPIYRLVKFWTAHVWNGPMKEAFAIQMRSTGEIDAEAQKHLAPDPKTKNLMARIDDILRWSNMAQKREDYVRELVLKGGIAIKIAADTREEASDPDRVILQNIHNEYVSEIEINDRLHVTRIRMDVPKTRYKEDETVEEYWITELWDMNGMRRWEHDQGYGASVMSLGTPTRMTLEECGTAKYGLDGEALYKFLPWVYAPFEDVGETRGRDAWTAVYAKIRAANEMATWLPRMVFRNGGPLWAALSDFTDEKGLPLPAPELNAEGRLEGTSIELNGEPFISLTARDLKCLVPPIEYEQILRILEAQEVELEKDLPELVAYELIRAAKQGQIAAATVRLLLEPAFAKVSQVTSNANEAMVRALQIALTVAQNMLAGGNTNFAEFSEEKIGSYVDKGFDFEIAPRDIYPLTDLERAQADVTLAQADAAMAANGIPWPMILERRGYSRDQIAIIVENQKRMAAEAEAKAEKDVETAKKPAKKEMETVIHANLSPENETESAVRVRNKEE